MQDAFRLELPSELARVGDAIATISGRCFADGLASPRTRFRLCTVLAEALGNAMLYGNGGDPNRCVTIEVAIDDDRIILAVSDQGDGFDHAATSFQPGDDSLEATRGRGLFVIRHLADHVEFNERGNTIWVTLPRH